MNEVEVSIVICTHRRFDLLAGAVQSLIDQTAPHDSYEVIVVDNDHQSNPAVRDVVSNAGPKILIKYLHEPKLGLSHARNAGGKLAVSNYIGYMDDDAKANPDYIELLLKVLHERTPDIVGGPFYPFYLDPKPVWFLDRYGSSSLGDEPRYLMSREYLIGNNIVFRRDLLDEVGWFDPNLGMTGKKVWYGEETIVQILAWKTNQSLKVYYDPKCFILHLVPCYKLSVWWIAKEAYLKGYSQAFFWTSNSNSNSEGYRFLYRLVRLSLSMSLKCLKLIFHNRQKYPFWQNYFVDVIANDIRRMGSLVRMNRTTLQHHKYPFI